MKIRLLSTLAVIVAAIASSTSAAASAAIKQDWLYRTFECIHRYEGRWNANTGNGYYGGLQMDKSFQWTYGREFVHRYGLADQWPVWAQILAAKRAYYGYGRYGPRGFGPWPNSRKMCGV